MTTLLDTLLDVAFDAAKLIREVYDTPFKVDFKGPADPVTVADVQAERTHLHPPVGALPRSADRGRREAIRRGSQGTEMPRRSSSWTRWTGPRSSWAETASSSS